MGRKSHDRLTDYMESFLEESGCAQNVELAGEMAKAARAVHRAFKQGQKFQRKPNVRGRPKLRIVRGHR